MQKKKDKNLMKTDVTTLHQEDFILHLLAGSSMT